MCAYFDVCFVSCVYVDHLLISQVLASDMSTHTCNHSRVKSKWANSSPSSPSAATCAPSILPPFFFFFTIIIHHYFLLLPLLLRFIPLLRLCPLLRLIPLFRSSASTSAAASSSSLLSLLSLHARERDMSDTEMTLSVGGKHQSEDLKIQQRMEVRLRIISCIYERIGYELWLTLYIYTQICSSPVLSLLRSHSQMHSHLSVPISGCQTQTCTHARSEHGLLWLKHHEHSIR